MGLPNVNWRKLPGAECPEPHHAHAHDEKAHKAHHWKERAFCASICIMLHLVLEFGPRLFS